MEAASRIEVIRSRSNGILATAAEAFASRYPETLFLAGRGTVVPMGKGSLGVHRLTFVQFARQLAQPRMAELGLAPLNAFGSEALAAHVVFRAREGNLKHFRSVAALPGFSRALSHTLRDLRLAGTSPEDLAAGGDAARDLAILLRDYERELEDRALVDFAGVLDLAREAAETGEHRWSNLPVVLLDVPLESRAHQQLFEALCERAPRVLHAIHAPDGREDAEDSLARLRQNLFAQTSPTPIEDDGRFSLFSAPGEGLEAVEIARRIHALARAGMRFDNIAILLRNPERYRPVIEDALRRAGIPAYFSHGTVRPDPAGRAFLSLLHCAAENLSASRFAEYMSLGQIPSVTVPAEWVPPEDVEALAEERSVPESNRPMPWRWEQHLVDASVIGGRDRWERRLRGLEAEWALDKETNAERLEQLRNLREFALPLIDALANLPRAASWGDWLPALRDLAARALRAPDGVLAALAELEPMSSVGPVSLEEAIEVLSERLRFLRREPTSRRWGQVFVGSIDEARGREFGTVFLPGLAEGLFPKKINEDPLLLDEARAAIGEYLPSRADRIAEERERLHLAAGAARDRLIASYPRMEVAEARPRVPSFYALELPRAIHGALPELSAFEAQARDAAPARLNWPAPRETADAIDDAEYDLAAIAHGAAQHILQASPVAARSLRARWRRWHRNWHPVDGLIVSEEAALSALETQRLMTRPWSPSTLETFAVCPYKFALRGIYSLREREQPVALEKLDARTRGSLFHDVQKQLYGQLRDANALPVTLDNLKDALARLESVLEHVAGDYAEKLAPAIPRVWAAEIDDVRTDLRGWLQFAASNDNDWTPTQFELEFEADLLDRVKLKGRIDSVEQRGNVLRVTDYKTGKPPETIPRWVGGGQHLQPLLYALAAEQKLAATVEAGRLLYATQRGNYTLIQIPLDVRARQFTAKLLEDIDAMIAGGFLPPAPAKDACGICDYRLVCGPYEDRRSQKKDARDERLDTLYEIRGMA